MLEAKRKSLEGPALIWRSDDDDDDDKESVDEGSCSSSDENLELLWELFPDIDAEVIKATLIARHHDIDATVNVLVTESEHDPTVIKADEGNIFSLDWTSIFDSNLEAHNSKVQPRFGNGGRLSDCECAPLPLMRFRKVLHIRQNVFQEQMVWSAAIALAYLIEHQQVVVSGKSVIDLGAGTGFLGFVCALAGANVTITDLPEMLPHIVENAQRNQLNEVVSICEYTWGQEKESGLSPPFDVVLVSDCLYTGYVIPLLLRAILFLSNASTEIFLSYRRRQDDERRAFSLLSKMFDITVCSQELLPRHLQNVDIYICRLVRRGPPSSTEDDDLVCQASNAFHDDTLSRLGRPSCGWMTPNV